MDEQHTQRRRTTWTRTARAGASASLLALGLLAAACSSGQQVASNGSEPSTTATLPGDEFVAADPAALGRLIKAMAPVPASTDTTAKGTDPGDTTESTPDPSSPSTQTTQGPQVTNPTTRVTNPPVTNPPVTNPPVTNPPVTQGRAQPTPFNGSLSAEEQSIYNKISEVTGRSLTLDQNLMNAARSVPAGCLSSACFPAMPGGLPFLGSAPGYAAGSDQAAALGGAVGNISSGNGIGPTHVGVGAGFANGNFYYFWLMAVY